MTTLHKAAQQALEALEDMDSDDPELNQEWLGKKAITALPSDVARCIGADLPECATCRRRIDPPHERQTWTGPWELEGVPCEMRIPSDELSAVRRVGQGDRNPQAKSTHIQAL